MTNAFSFSKKRNSQNKIIESCYIYKNYFFLIKYSKEKKNIVLIEENTKEY